MFEITSQIKNYIIGGLGALFLLSLTANYVQRDMYNNCVAAREADQKAYKAEQQEAAAIAYRNALEVERKNAERAQQADAAYATLSSQYRASVLRLQAAQRTNLPTNLSATPNSTGSVDGPDPSAVVPEYPTDLTVSTEDALICADNTARLLAARSWALSTTTSPETNSSVSSSHEMNTQRR